MKRIKSDDPENPPLTDEELARLRPASAVLPRGMLAGASRYRGPQKAPTKQLVSLRMDRDLLEAYRATGKGWQKRIHATLAAHAPRRRGQTRTRAKRRSAGK